MAMIVRTYARRSRCPGHGGSTSPSSSDPFAIESVDIADSSQELPSFNLSSQDSSPWSLPPCPPRQPRKKKKARDPAVPAAAPSVPATVAATATLMEAQEFGEMMEHVDEVNFAIDGLRPRQPARTRRASLLSLLTICGTPRQRRLLRAQGMAKRIIDAVLCLNFDDSPSTVAAAALFFVLASDVQDDHLLDSPSCIQFLLKILDPKLTATIEGKAPAIGSKLLGILKPQTMTATNKELDSSPRKVISKVQEILLNCKEIKPCSQDEDEIGRPELTSKWISLLTMEKACLSTVSFEDTCETVKKVGGNFKERLRELGGLDAIFDVIIGCHSTMERLSKQKTPSVSQLKDGKPLESVTHLLKCLKIMENATFLSKDNQGHLLNMRGKVNAEGTNPSFVGIVISCIKLLSGFSLLRGHAGLFNKENSTCLIENIDAQNHASQSQMKVRRDKQHYTSTAEGDVCGGIEDSCMKMTKASYRHQKLTDSPSELSASCSEMAVDVYSAKEKADSNVFEFRDEALTGSNGGTCLNANGLKVNINNLKVNFSSNGLKVKSDNFAKRSHGWISIKALGSNSNSHGPPKATGSKADSCGPLKRLNMSEDVRSESKKVSFDPFAFDEDESKPSKWEKLPRKKVARQTLQSEVTNKEYVEGYEILSLPKGPSSSHSTNGDTQTLEDICPLVVEDTNLMEDCLLTSVKVAYGA